jgi:hypothetical protein
MSTREEIIRALGQLDPATFEDVITTAYQQRDASTDKADKTRPNHQAGPEHFAQWLARRHMSSDAAIERVVYLPAGSPANEIRLLEINRFLNAPDVDVIEPLDFSPVGELPYKVFVADVTMDQWEQIRREPGATLSDGWNLENNRIYSRD